ncbi:hypothetical protein AB0O76_28040 [Streptomyces sp. NPDC086554]|uniref:hypothetical protein n=1 Tax=Streptomyces sp. NPDC086554 TaxID=3154864 RepID=UPI003444301F
MNCRPAGSVRCTWLHTGDLGATDDEGDLRIVDRKKDLVIRGGYNPTGKILKRAIDPDLPALHKH